MRFFAVGDNQKPRKIIAEIFYVRQKDVQAVNPARNLGCDSRRTLFVGCHNTGVRGRKSVYKFGVLKIFLQKIPALTERLRMRVNLFNLFYIVFFGKKKMAYRNNFFAYYCYVRIYEHIERSVHHAFYRIFHGNYAVFGKTFGNGIKNFRYSLYRQKHSGSAEPFYRRKMRERPFRPEIAYSYSRLNGYAGGHNLSEYILKMFVF